MIIKKRYIWQDDKTYKLLETPKEVQEERLRVSYDRGYECGELSALWFSDYPKEISDSQITKFRLVSSEYKRGFKEGYENAKKRLSEHG